MPRDLCNSCKDILWGQSGWKQFFNSSTGYPELDRCDRKIKKRMWYIVEPKNLYEQSRDCHWCYRLITESNLPRSFEDFQPFGSEPINVNMEFYAPFRADSAKINSIHVRLDFSQKVEANVCHNHRFAIWSKPGNAGSDVFFTPSECRDREPGFDANLASTWISACRNTHGSCEGEEGVSRMPTRILDLSGPMKSDFVLRATEDEDAEYACLSYKWGNTNRLEVDFPSLARSMFNSPMSPQDRLLPPTFRDAIQVARSIGINYLWIDALCIWQDEDDDKRLELERMNRYYANCTLVIQASGTESVSEGFLDLAYRSRNRKIFESYSDPLPFKSPNGQEGTVYVCSGDELDWYRKSDQPAAKRGWIFQEEVLCRRILTFPAGGGMIFRCDSHYMETDDGNVFYDPEVSDPSRYWTRDRLLERGEDLSPALISLPSRWNATLEAVRSLSEVSGSHPTFFFEKDGNFGIRLVSDDDADGSSEDNFLLPVKGKSAEAPAEAAAYAKTMAVLRRPGLPDALIHTRTPPGVVLPEEIHDIWKRLVAEYCARDLTKPSDKLIAIGALAREFQERYGRALGSYHTGLWSHFSPAGLLWYSTRPAPPDAEFIVPSWSWAAVRAASYTEPEKYTDDIIGGADFIDADIKLSSFVPAEDGDDEVEQIKLVAKLLNVWWGPNTIPQQGGTSYALFQDNGEVLSEAVYLDHSVDLPPCDRESVAMMLGRRYMSGIGHDQDHQGEVLLLRVREDGTYVRRAFAKVCFDSFQEIWEPRFKVETIVLA